MSDPSKSQPQPEAPSASPNLDEVANDGGAPADPDSPSAIHAQVMREAIDDVLKEAGEISSDQMRAMITALQNELDAKTAELADRQDAFLRAVAETDNVRRRLEKEKVETAKYAISKFAKDILTVGDNFQRAIDAVPKQAAETDPALKTLLDGVILAERDFRSALDRHGVKSINPAGEVFNPHHHQAVMEQNDPGVPAGTVLQVYQTGYLIDDRCLRPAMVVVARGGPKPDKSGDDASKAKVAEAQSPLPDEPPQADDPEQS